MTEKDLLAEAKDTFKACEDAESDNRKNGLDDLKFARLGEQWPKEIQELFKRQGRRCLTINRMPAFLRQVVNDSRQNKPSIKVHPADSAADVETAKMLAELIRNIEYTSNADVAYDTGIDFAASMGFGYIGVDLDYACDDTFDLDIKIRRIANPFSIYGDPYSTEADSSDWNDAFETEMIKKDRYKQLYPKFDVSNWNADGTDEKTQDWFDAESVRVAKWWRRSKVKKTLLLLSDGTAIYEEDFLKPDADTGFSPKDMAEASGLTVVRERETESHEVKCRLMNGGQIIETTDWVGKYIPIIPIYGDEINVEGKRTFKSLIHDAKDAQMMFNFWRSMTTEAVALAPKAPYVGAVGSFATDADKWITANSENHSFLEYDPVNGAPPPSRQPFAGIPAGALQEAMNASDDMKSIMGLFDASLGAKSNETSGKAILARQKEGDVSTFHFIDNMTRAIRHTGRVVIDLIPHVYNTARILRVMGEDGTPRAVQVNQQFQDAAGQMRIHDLRAGKYDITVSSGPSYNTRRQESADQMMELLRAFPQAAPVIGDLFAKNLDWPGAEEIAERLKAINPALKPPEDPMQNPEIVMQREKLNIEKEKAAQDMQIEREKMDLQRKQAMLDAEIKLSGHDADMEMMGQKHSLSMQQSRDTAMQKMGSEMMEQTAQTGEDGAPAQHPLMQLLQAVIQSNQVVAEAVSKLAVSTAASAAAPKTITMRTSQGKQLTAQVQPVLQ